MEQVHRRTLLTGVATAFGGLAGCSSNAESNRLLLTNDSNEQRKVAVTLTPSRDATTDPVYDRTLDVPAGTEIRKEYVVEDGVYDYRIGVEQISKTGTWQADDDHSEHSLVVTIGAGGIVQVVQSSSQ